MADVTNRLGQVLGHYKLMRVLGRGGFADVYLGEHIHLNTLAAIKILHAQLAEDSIEHFRHEARTLAHLNHPNIVEVLDFGVEGNTPFLVMQYAPNGTLRQRHPRGTPVPLNLVVSYVRQVAAALQYAHNQKLIHRDIKPENMLVGEQNQILLSDFGIAIVTQSMRAQHQSIAVGVWDPAGTAAYMAPEQIQGRAVPASDQYALAIVVYEWLTGSLPFSGSYMEVVSQQISASPAPLRAKVPSIPSEVEQVVLTALNKDPQQRFARIEAFATALEQAAQADSFYVVQAPASSPGAARSIPGTEVPSMEAALIGPQGRTVIGPAKVTLGSAPDNTLVLSDPRVSAHHAEVRPEGSGFAVEDLHSTNGTFVNEQPVYPGAPRLLQPGDILSIGSTRFTFQLTEGPQVSSHAGDAMIGVAPPPLAPVPLLGAMSNFMGNTSYGMGGTIPAQVAPPVSQYPSESQVPTYIPPVPGQSGGQPALTPNLQGITPGQQPVYTPNQQPVLTSGQQPIVTPPQYPPPQPTPKPSPVRAILLVVIALVIILGGVGSFLIYHNNQVAQENAHATATAQAVRNAHVTATALAQQHATAIAIQNATATVTAIQTSHYPPFTSVALYDPLTDSVHSAWSTTSDCQFTPTGYQISVAQADSYYWCRAATNYIFSDFAFQVDMTINNGDCGGMLFRFPDPTNTYIFQVCQNGVYSINLKVNGAFPYKTILLSNSAINKGPNQTNVIAVAVQGNTINMYVNYHLIDSVTDSTFSRGGIALIATDYTNPTSVTYTNAVVWTQSS